jgi:catechol 2,3-dioxygenase-like lactoylglutathione lyase family enzyme
MKGDVDIFHHVGLIVADIEGTVRAYERLGFRFAPLSVHKFALKPGEPLLPLGTGNHCAIFRNNFLEIVGVIDPSRWQQITIAQRGPYNVDAFINRYEGLHVMHFGADDIEVVRERYRKTGVKASDITRIERNVETPDGPRMMKAETLYFPPGTNPEGAVQVACHRTPELVLQPRYMDHANGATSITECIVCTPETAAYAAKYERYSGHTARQAGELHVLDLGYSRVIVVAPEDLGAVVPGAVPPALPFLAGFTVAGNLDRARAHLNNAKIPLREHGGRLVVAPEHGCGSAVLFEAEGAKRA